MLISDRDASRRMFRQVRDKQRRGAIMEPLEHLISTVILGHPEYHELLDHPDHMHMEFTDPGRVNPYLHMGLHIALIEQLSTDRPPGVTAVYRSLLAGCDDEHNLQHRCMECLGEALHEAASRGVMPDERAYLEALRRLT